MSKFSDKVTGNQVSADEYNNLTRALKNSIEDSGQTIDATNIQTSKSMANNAAVATFYTENGAADVYNLIVIDNFEGLTKLIDGAEARFRAANLNTGASTVNVAGTGARDIKLPDGTTDPAAGDISTTQDTKIRYDLGNNVWVLDNNKASETIVGIAEIATQAEVDGETDDKRIVTSLKLATKPNQIRQLLFNSSGSFDSTPNNVPFDNTSPQLSEGKVFLSQAITPKVIGNKLFIDLIFIGGSGGSNTLAALFKDGDTTPLKVASNCADFSSGEPVTITFTVEFTIASLTPITFKLWGSSESGTCGFNGVGGNARFNGLYASSIEIIERQV